MITGTLTRSISKTATCLLLISLACGVPFGPANPQVFDRDRWNRGFYLAASIKNAVIPVRSGATENQRLLLVDYETGRRTKLKSEGSHLLSPYLSPDGSRLLFSRQFLDRGDAELVSCNTVSLTCRLILRSPGSIHSAIEISEGRILYVSSPYFKGGDGRIRLGRNDIWVFDPKKGARQLTDFGLYQLHSLSVAQKHIYFSAYGRSRDRLVFPQPQPRDDRQSSIFRLPFDPEKAVVESPSATLTPLFASEGIASHPTVSANGSMLAFIRTRTHSNPYHYNLVIVDQDTGSERVIEAAGWGYSRPVIIDRDVYASVTGPNRISIQVNRWGERSMETLADIDEKSIANAESVELNIDHP